MIWMAMTIGLAAAGDAPARCVASWSGATEGCGVREAFTVQAGGRGVAQGEKAARAQLAEALARHGVAVRARYRHLSESDFALCDEAASKAYVDCFPGEELAERRLCFAALDAPLCWDGDVITFTGVGWKAIEQGRTRMCAAVDAQVVERDYTGITEARAQCRATCETETTVRCPASGGLAVTR